MAASIRFEKGDDRTTVYLSHGGSNLHLTEQFARVLHGYSLAAVNKVSCTQIRVVKGLGQGGGDYGSVRLYAKLLIEEDDDDNRKTYGILIPAPRAGLFDDDQRVLDPVGVAITSAYSTFAGKKFVFKEGWLYGASGDSNL